MADKIIGVDTAVPFDDLPSAVKVQVMKALTTRWVQLYGDEPHIEQHRKTSPTSYAIEFVAVTNGG